MENALWISRMSDYDHSPLRIQTARTIIGIKTRRQQSLLARYKIRGHVQETNAHSLNGLLLIEARAAVRFWRAYRSLLPRYPEFTHRAPHASDTVNQLLDVGYHHLAGVVKKLLETHAVPLSLGVLHVPHTTSSTPLVYDLMELFRSDIVDAEVARFLRLKKKVVVSPSNVVPHFLHEVNQRLQDRHYLHSFGKCESYRYYMELQILRFIHAVNHREVFNPIWLPVRHDMRCTVDTSRTPGTVQNSKLLELREKKKVAS